MSTSERPTVSIVGAGLGGALMAAFLGKAGYPVRMYEKRPDPRRGDVPAGRSINLALSTRGIHPLEELGIAGDILRQAIPMRGRMMHAVSGELTYQPYGTEPHHYINSVSRAGLNMALLHAAEQYAGVELCFDCRCTDVDLEGPSVRMLNGEGREQVSPAGGILIGADGAFSAVRARLQRLERFNYSQEYLSHGYKELTIPPATGGGFQLQNNALHIWPRGGFMMIALPNLDGSFTCTLFWPYSGPVSFEAARSNEEVLRLFETQFPDALPLMPTLVDDFRENPVGSLVTIRCDPWYHEDKVVLLGDAAHAVVPFYGQGMNASFEDCSILNECVLEHAPDFGRVFQAYHQRRKKHVDALADLAILNFLEMRDHVASPLFLLSKKMERLLHRLFPDWFVPLYSMVTFSRIPYAQARSRARRQNHWVNAWLILLGAGIATLLLMLLT